MSLEPNTLLASPVETTVDVTRCRDRGSGLVQHNGTVPSLHYM